MHHMNLGEEDAKRAVVAAGTMLGISVLGSLIYLPILMKSLKGMRKVYIILQQICIIGFLLTQLLNHIIMNEADYLYAFRAVGIHADDREPITLAEIFWRRLLASLFQSFFRYTQYFLSFMQSWDIYKMIHDPLSYASFCAKINVFKYLAIGLGICIVLVLEFLIEIIAVHVIITDPKEFILDGPQMVQFLSFTNVLDKYSLVKFIIIKVVYSGVIIVIATKTKAALQQSADFNSDAKKERLYKRLFIFTLIPLAINFWYLFPECLNVIWPLNEIIYDTHSRDFFARKDIRTYVSATIATFASFSYFVAFPLLFPKVKEAIMCRKQEGEVEQ